LVELTGGHIAAAHVDDPSQVSKPAVRPISSQEVSATTPSISVSTTSAATYGASRKKSSAADR
jgi:hypothetical protein